MDFMDFSKGRWVWYTVGTQIFPGQIADDVAASAKETTVITTEEELVVVKMTDVKIMHESNVKGVEDMILLSELHEYSLLHNLRLRYKESKIYTYTGTILVAVNPYQVIPGLYDMKTVRQYDKVPIGELPPHIFAIGNASYYSLYRTQQNQCVVISGESGAGKTESTKLIIQNFAALSTKQSLIQEQIVEASPIMEAFGNAKTVRNDNSSRFGKFIEVQFQSGSIVGARVLDYLLERSRIVHQSPDERNYHIFYCLISGADKALKSKLKLTKAQDFHYLNQSGCIKVDKIDDVEDFDKITSAMKVLNFGESELSCFEILASVLHLGNVNYQKNAEENADIVNPDNINTVCEILGVDPAKTTHALLNRSITQRGETFYTPLNVAQALDSRDGLAKALYGRMFTWILRKINDTICKPGTHQFVGVLDIFGFEDFKENSFEQFCINYANERLQFYFNQHIFKLEQEEYTREGIDWTKIDFVDNQPCIDLISKKPVGLLNLLDEESNFPKGTDKSLLAKFKDNFAKNEFFETPKLKDNEFSVVHYAGKVTYLIEGFLDKNRDALRGDIMDCMGSSTKQFVADLFTDRKSGGDDSDKSGTARRTVSKLPTVGALFHQSLSDLMTTLTSCNPYFVRCVKPNQNKSPNEFDNELILAQLRYSGMLETIRIRRAGYSVRLPFKEFVFRYRIMLNNPEAEITKDMKQAIRKILETAWPQNPNDYQLGKTKVFMRNPVENSLEAHRGRRLGRYVIIMQKNFRMWLARGHYKRDRKRVIRIQAAMRGKLGRVHYLQARYRCVRLQALIRGWRARRKYIPIILENRRKRLEAEAEARRKAEEELARIRAEEEARIAAEEARLAAGGSPTLDDDDSDNIDDDLALMQKELALLEYLENAAGEEDKQRINQKKRDADAKRQAEMKKQSEMAPDAPPPQIVERRGLRPAIEPRDPINATLFMLPSTAVSELQAARLCMVETIESETVKQMPVRVNFPPIPTLQKGDLEISMERYKHLLQTLENAGGKFRLLASLLGDDIKGKTYARYAKVIYKDGVSSSYSDVASQFAITKLAPSFDPDASAISAVILKFVHEAALTDSYILRMINFVLEKVIKAPQLGDEFLSQLLRSSYYSPSTSVEWRSWLFLYVAVGVVPASDFLFPTLLHYVVESAPKNLSERIQRRLWRCKCNCQDARMLTSLEYTTLMDETSLFLPVEAPDGQIEVMEGDSAVTAEEFIESVLTKRDVKVTTGYALFATMGDKEIRLVDKMKILTTIKQFEDVLAKDKSEPFEEYLPGSEPVVKKKERMMKALISLDDLILPSMDDFDDAHLKKGGFSKNDLDELVPMPQVDAAYSGKSSSSSRTPEVDEEGKGTPSSNTPTPPTSTSSLSPIPQSLKAETPEGKRSAKKEKGGLLSTKRGSTSSVGEAGSSGDEAPKEKKGTIRSRLTIGKKKGKETVKENKEGEGEATIDEKALKKQQEEAEKLRQEEEEKLKKEEERLKKEEEKQRKKEEGEATINDKKLKKLREEEEKQRKKEEEKQRKKEESEATINEKKLKKLREEEEKQRKKEEEKREKEEKKKEKEAKKTVKKKGSNEQPQGTATVVKDIDAMFKDTDEMINNLMDAVPTESLPSPPVSHHNPPSESLPAPPLSHHPPSESLPPPPPPFAPPPPPPPAPPVDGPAGDEPPPPPPPPPPPAPDAEAASGEDNGEATPPAAPSENEDGEAPPPPPPPAAPAPPTNDNAASSNNASNDSSSVSNKAPQSNNPKDWYPWRLTVRKEFIGVSDVMEPSEERLISVQIMNSEQGRAQESVLKPLFEESNFAEIIKIAKDWPFYFRRACDVMDPISKSTKLYLDANKVYLVNPSRKENGGIFAECTYSEVEIVRANAELLDIKMGDRPFALKGDGLVVEEVVRSIQSSLIKTSKYAIATRDHEVDDWNLLPFKRGDLITISERDYQSGWFRGEIGERIGWFPKEHVAILLGPPKDPKKELEKIEAKIASQKAASGFGVSLTQALKTGGSSPGGTVLSGLGTLHGGTIITGAGTIIPAPGASSTGAGAGAGTSADSGTGTLKRSIGVAPLGQILMNPTGSVRSSIGHAAPVRQSIADPTNFFQGTSIPLAKKPAVPKMDVETIEAADGHIDSHIDSGVGKFTMIEYAKANFRIDQGKIESTGTMKKKLTMKKDKGGGQDSADWGWREVVKNIKFSTEPIKMSLHKALDVNDNKMAVDMFLAVLSYMGDYPTKNSSTQLVQHLIAAGLKRPPLRDEIYCQVIKQMTNNRSVRPDSLRRGWDLMVVIVSCFPPSEVFLPYLTAYFSSFTKGDSRDYSDTAEECLKRLNRAAKLGPRKLPPTQNEILAIESNSPMSIRIHFPGETSRMFMIDSVTTATEVMGKVSSKIHVTHPEEFGLYIVSNGSSVPILPQDYILDVLNVTERLAAVGSPSKEKSKHAPFTMIFQKKLWLSNKIDKDADMVTVILFFQLKEDYLQGYMFSQRELGDNFLSQAAEYAALLIRGESGTKATHIDLLEKFVPAVLYSKRDANFWKAAVSEKLNAIDPNISELDCRRNFLQKLDILPYFGHTFFDIKADNRLPNGGVVAINFSGIKVIDKDAKVPLMAAGFDAIVNFRFDDTEFVIKTGDLMSKSMMRLQTREGFTIADLIQSYIQAYVQQQQVMAGRSALAHYAAI